MSRKRWPSIIHDRYGMKTDARRPARADASATDEVFYNGDVVDLAYRDYAVSRLARLAEGGRRTSARCVMLFQQNRIISSIAAELDQKSCWEVLTDPQFAQKYFSADERQIFRRHILWTRILSDRRTLLADGRVRRPARLRAARAGNIGAEAEPLLWRPGRRARASAGAAEWETAIERALADRERWVVQQLASIPVSEFPVIGPDGKVHVEPFYTVMGFAPTKYGVAILARASQKQVVNVAQRGGMCVVLIGHPPGRLIGPGPLPKPATK